MPTLIIGVGIDLCMIDRMQRAIDRHGERLVERLFTQSEAVASAGRKDRAAFLAKRFAAKEALAKAMGTGFRDGLWFRQMAVSNDPLGRPVMRVSGEAERRLHALGRTVAIHLSLSDEGGMAIAMVVLEQLER